MMEQFAKTNQVIKDTACETVLQGSVTKIKHANKIFKNIFSSDGVYEIDERLALEAITSDNISLELDILLASLNGEMAVSKCDYLNILYRGGDSSGSGNIEYKGNANFVLEKSNELVGIINLAYTMMGFKYG